MPTYDVAFHDPVTGRVELRSPIEGKTEADALRKARAFLKPRMSMAHWVPNIVTAPRAAPELAPARHAPPAPYDDAPF